MSWPYTTATRFLSSLLVSLLIGWLGVGCATIDPKIDGTTDTMRWEVTGCRNYMMDLEEREVYAYTLVLEDTQGSTITFTELTADIRNNPHSRAFHWERWGQWVLPAKETDKKKQLYINLGTYRHCIAANCKNWGPLAPEWDLTLSGKNAQEQRVTEVIQMRLPYVADTVGCN